MRVPHPHAVRVAHGECHPRFCGASQESPGLDAWPELMQLRLNPATGKNIEAFIWPRIRIVDPLHSLHRLEKFAVAHAIAAQHQRRGTCALPRSHSQNVSLLLIEDGRPYLGPKKAMAAASP